MSRELAAEAIDRLKEWAADERAEDVAMVAAWVRELEASVRTADEALSQRRVAIDRLTDQRTEATRALIDFKERVRDEAQQHVANSNECIQGLNEVLERLGLEKVKIAYEVTLSIMYEPRRFTITVEADSEEQAAETVKTLMGEEKYGDTEGAWDDLEIRDIDVADVTEAD